MKTDQQIAQHAATSHTARALLNELTEEEYDDFAKHCESAFCAGPEALLEENPEVLIADLVEWNRTR